MRFGVLGSLEVWDDGGRSLATGSPKQRLVLAALLCFPNQVVPVDRLVDMVWRGAPPPTGRKNIQIYVRELRRALGDADRIQYRAPGYLLTVGPDELDSERFERLAAEGRRARERGRTEAAARLLADALAYWRGDPFSDVDEVEVVRQQVFRLNELRLVACEERLAADLALGRHAECTAELSTLVHAHPLRERFRAQLMLALYRSGRQAEALETYRDGRRLLVDELGIEPGPELRKLERAVLAEDPTLDLVAPAPQASQPDASEAQSSKAQSSEPEPPAPEPSLAQLFGLRSSESEPAKAASLPDRPSTDRPSTDRRPIRTPVGTPVGVVQPPIAAELPPDTPAFTGRDDLLARLWSALTSGQTPIAIDGPGGVGKSALAIHAAHSVADQFSDGQLYVNLRGATPGVRPLAPNDVLARFLRTLGEDDTRIPDELDEATARFRSLTADRQLLLVLDDAVDAGQVRPLLPGGAGCAVLVTSRRVLGTLDAVHLALDVMNEKEAVTLLGRLIGDDRVGREPDAAHSIVELCGLLPLAIRVVGARMLARREWTLDTLAGQLSDARGRLRELEHDELDLRASLLLGYDGLRTSPNGVEAGRLFELLGLLDVHDLTVPVAAALADRPEPAVRQALDRLVAARLVESPLPGRYTLHDLVRLYARDQAVRNRPESERQQAILRVLHWYLATARNACRMLDPTLTHRHDVGLSSSDLAVDGLALADPAECFGWVDDEQANLLAIARQAAAATDVGVAAVTPALAAAMFVPLRQLARWMDLSVLCQLAREVADRTNEPTWRAWAHNDLGSAYLNWGRIDEAAEHLERALLIWRELGFRPGEVATVNGLGRICLTRRQFDKAIEYFDGMLRMHREDGDRYREARALNNLANAHQKHGQLAEAIAMYEQGLAIRRELGDRRGEGITLGNLAEAHRLSGDLDIALPHFERAVGLTGAAGQPVQQAEFLWFGGYALHDSGRTEQAALHWRRALDILCDLDLLDSDQADAILAEPVPAVPEPIRLQS